MKTLMDKIDDQHNKWLNRYKRTGVERVMRFFIHLFPWVMFGLFVWAMVRVSGYQV